MQFKQVKEQLDIIAVARDYGIVVNRHNKALCFAHKDTRPSLSFKGQRYKCFACGASGDVIDMVSTLTGQSPLEAAQSIDAVYGLGLFSQSIDKSELDRLRQEREAKAEAKRQERETHENALSYLATWLRTHEKHAPDSNCIKFLCKEHQFEKLICIC